MAARTRWWALAAVSLATLMTYLDNNVTNVALPTIERSLHVSVSGLEWIVSSYLLVLGGLLLVGGRIADVYGRRRVFLTGMVIFTLSSLAAGLSGSTAMLIAARAVQGLGAALLMPADPGDHRRRLHQHPGADRRDRHLGRGRGPRPRPRPGHRRGHQPAPALGLDLPHQRAPRRHCPRNRLAVGRGVARGR